MFDKEVAGKRKRNRVPGRKKAKTDESTAAVRMADVANGAQPSSFIMEPALPELKDITVKNNEHPLNISDDLLNHQQTPSPTAGGVVLAGTKRPPNEHDEAFERELKQTEPDVFVNGEIDQGE